MFGKKKETGIPVQHYQGIKDFAQDYPCRIEVKGDIFEIKRIKPETIVTLPMERITSFSAMEEPNFMIKYQGDKARTSKFASGKKYYLVVNYTTQDGSDAMLAFWGTSFEWGYFIDLQNRNTSTEAEPTSYSL